jgi:hypothetical protein
MSHPKELEAGVDGEIVIGLIELHTQTRSERIGRQNLKSKLLRKVVFTEPEEEEYEYEEEYEE